MLDGQWIGWYEPVYKDTINNWEWLTSTLKPITVDKSEQEKRIKLATGGLLEMWSLEDKETSRGRHYDFVFINEVSKIRHIQYSWEYVIRITLADRRGGAMLCSTPKGYDYFQQMYTRGQDPQNKQWKSWQRSSWENPYLPRDELEEMQRTLPEITYRQEIMAEFITSDGMVFRRVHDAAVLDSLDKPLEGHQYVMGVDVAAAVDYTVITILDAQSKEMVYIDRFNRVDYPTLEDRIHADYRLFNCTGAVIEANSIGAEPIQRLQQRGLSITPFTTTNVTKHAIIQGLQSAFEHSQIKILDNPVLVGELLSFESKKNAGGTFSYSAPEGQHDDCVMSLALAWYAVDMAQPLILFGA